MATVKFHVFKDKMVHAIYSDTADEALTEGITAETIINEMSESAESGVEIPEMKELRMLTTSCKKNVNTGKFAIRAVLRYVPVSDESESE